MDKIPTRTTTTSIPDTVFDDFTEKVFKAGWTKKTIKNEIIFNKKGKELIFRFFNNKIEVSIPLKESDENYVTSFTSYFQAIEYGEMHIDFN